MPGSAAETVNAFLMLCIGGLALAGLVAASRYLKPIRQILEGNGQGNVGQMTENVLDAVNMANQRVERIEQKVDRLDRRLDIVEENQRAEQSWQLHTDGRLERLERWARGDV